MVMAVSVQMCLHVCVCVSSLHILCSSYSWGRRDRPSSSPPPLPSLPGHPCLHCEQTEHTVSWTGGCPVSLLPLGGRSCSECSPWKRCSQSWHLVCFIQVGAHEKEQTAWTRGLPTSSWSVSICPREQCILRSPRRQASQPNEKSPYLSFRVSLEVLAPCLEEVPNYAMLCYAKSLQSCLTLCDPIDGSPPGSAVPGIL